MRSCSVSLKTPESVVPELVAMIDFAHDKLQQIISCTTTWPETRQQLLT
jgi:hypothetical protein